MKNQMCNDIAGNPNADEIGLSPVDRMTSFFQSGNHPYCILLQQQVNCADDGLKQERGHKRPLGQTVSSAFNYHTKRKTHGTKHMK